MSVGGAIFVGVTLEEWKFVVRREAAERKLTVVSFFVVENTDKFLEKIRLGLQPTFNPSILVEHNEYLVSLIDGGRCVIHSVAVKSFIDDHNPRGVAVALKPETVVLKASARTLVESNVVINNPLAFKNASPILHSDVEEVYIGVRIQNRVIILGLKANGFTLKVLYAIFIGCQAIVIRASKIQIILLGIVI